MELRNNLSDFQEKKKQSKVLNNKLYNGGLEERRGSHSRTARIHSSEDSVRPIGLK